MLDKPGQWPYYVFIKSMEVVTMESKAMKVLGLVQVGTLVGALITSAVAWAFNIEWLLRLMF